MPIPVCFVISAGRLHGSLISSLAVSSNPEEKNLYLDILVFMGVTLRASDRLLEKPVSQMVVPAVWDGGIIAE